MADISKVTVGSTTYNIKDSTARTHISDTDIHTTAAEKSDWNSKASGTHTHGNITNGGDITSNVAITSGDRLVINDESASKINNSSITFGTSETEFLTNKGTWKTPLDTTYSAGTGLSLNSTTFNHSNSITAGTAGTSTATSGTTTLAVPYITYDAQGHITASGTHTHTISSFPEAYLSWGGRNFSSSYGPIDAAMIDVLGANRFAFLKAAGLIIEYSTDNGTNWSDYGATDLQKVGLFSSGQAFYLGKHTTTGSCTVNDLLRVTISTSPAGICTVLNKIAIYMSTSGSTVEVKIEKALESTPTSFSTHLDWTSISGWSGWNILNISSITTYGNTASSQYGRIRFIFRATKVNTNYTAANISKIMGFGGVGWSTPSNMAATGHLYSFDAAQNATFPSKVTATSFNGDLSKDKILLNGSKYYESASNYVMNFNNSDIIGLNGMYFVDAADGVGEGIHFYRDSTHWDSIRAYSGNLQFSPNRSNNTAGTWYDVYHTNNKPALADLSGDATHRLVTDTQISAWDSTATNSHTHSNKSALDAVTSTKMTNWDTAYSNSHTHSNKTALDAVTSTKMTNWDTAYSNSHSHSNKSALDAITSTKMTNWDNAATNSHSHSNKANLDAITATKMTNWDTAYSNSHTHSNKAVLDTVTSDVVNNSHTHSNKTALDAITSTKMTNWDNAATNSHTHSNKTVLDGISSTDITNWNAKVPSTRTVNGKALSSDIDLMLYDLAPTMTKTYTNVIGTANNWAGATFFWGSVKPTSWNALWEVKFYIKTYVPGKAGYEQESYVIVSGSYGSLRSYLCWNNVSAYYVTYFYELYRMKEAGFNNGYGHALGSRFYGSYNPTNANYKRTIEIEIYETKNCTFTFFDSCLAYSAIPGTGSTNYDAYSGLNACSNGMQKTGDANDPNYQNRVYYTSRKTKTALYRYQICFSTLDGKILPVNTVSNSTSVGKTLTTESFDPFGEIYFYNSTTDKAVDAVVGDATLYRQVLADFRYSFNIGSGSYFTAYNPVYIKCVPQSNGSVKLDTSGTTPLTQTLPNSDDGLLYIYMGFAYPDTNPYRLELSMHHPIYYYKDGAIRLWTNPRNISDIGLTGNLADGFDDSSHRLVTDLQIDTWNAKSNFSGAYSDLTGKPTIPTTLAQLSGDSTHRVVTDTQINTWTDAYTLPSGGIPFNDLSQAVQDLLTNTSALFDTEVIISDVYLKRYAAGRLMISKVE